MRWGSGRHPPHPPRRLGDGSLPLPPDGWRGHRRSTTWGLLSMFDKAKLDALRAKYNGAKETEVAPETVPKTAVPGVRQRLSPRDALCRALRPCWTHRIGRMRPICPISPGSMWHWSACRWISASPTAPGARLGPRAVRDVERIGPYNHALEVTPRGECNVADIGDVPLRSRFSLDSSIEDIAAFYARIRQAGVRPALGRRRPLDHLSDPEGARRRAPGRPRPYRRPLRHDGRDRRLEVPPWRAVPPGGARRRARPGAHDPDRHPRPGRDLLGVLLRIPG